MAHPRVGLFRQVRHMTGPRRITEKQLAAPPRHADITSDHAQAPHSTKQIHLRSRLVQLLSSTAGKDIIFACVVYAHTTQDKNAAQRRPQSLQKAVGPGSGSDSRTRHNVRSRASCERETPSFPRQTFELSFLKQSDLNSTKSSKVFLDHGQLSVKWTPVLRPHLPQRFSDSTPPLSPCPESGKRG